MAASRRQAGAYFLLCLALRVVVDFGTGGGFRPSYFATYMPALLVFYVGYPLVFTWLVFGRRLGAGGLLVATLAAIFIVEALFVHNLWVMAFPMLLVGIPLAVAVYAPLTFFPLWAVRGEMGRRRRTVVALCR